MKFAPIPMILSGVAAAALLTIGTAHAQKGQGKGPMHYNVAAEITVKGTVQDVKPGPQQGMHVLLGTNDGTLEMALGPSWYQTEKKYVIAKGDELEVVGVKTKMNDRDVMLVREIRKGSETMTFRDAKGFPMWAGRGRT
jgi:DNA/RNA endonuclease YhcR with UshA esterase domain